jgi:NADPH2:quinone reductase
MDLHMKTWQVHQFCEPGQMVFADAPLPQPGEGEVLIRNRAAGINFFDILQIQGKYQSKPSFPFTVGAEVAGVVEALGPGVTQVRPGDRVLAFTMSGGYAECSLAPAWKTFRIPGDLSFPEAAALPVVYQTSYFALDHRARLRKDEWLLVHAGASGVGMAAIQLGRAFGARVIATAGSEEKLEFCRSLGAEDVLSYAGDDWVENVKEITGRGADVIYDPVGGDVFDLSTKCIASDGRLLVVGFASGRIPSLAANRVLLKNMSVVGAFWGRHVDENPEYLTQTQASLFELHRGGKVRPAVSRAYPLAEARTALDDLSRRRVIGKAVLVMDE